MKIEGVSIAKIAKKEETVIKTTIKTQLLRTETPHDHASVLAARHDLNSAANVVKARLSTAFAAAVKSAAAPMSADDAKAKADSIIAKNGGREKLDTDGVGRDLAEIAKTDPAGARAVQVALLGETIDQNDKGKIKERDKDEIAQSFTNHLTDGDLAKLANSDDGRALLDRFEHHLLSGDVHGDERRTADRIEAQLSNTRTFSDWNQGIDPNSELAMTTPYGKAFDANSSPEEAAAALKSNNRFSYDPASDVQAFTDQLAAHKDDPQWIQSYYAALGKDKAAELISLAATPSGYSNYLFGSSGSAEAADVYNRNMSTIAASLETLRQSAAFGQGDMDKLVATMADKGFSPNLVPDMFAKATPEVREMFVRAAEKSDKPVLDAAAAYVLGTMTDSKQAQILGDFATTPGRVEGFVKNAMAGQFNAIDMANYLRTGIADKYTAVGAAGIIETAARGKQYYGSQMVPPPFSDALRLQLFDGATKGLTDDKTFNNLSGDLRFKNALAQLAISQHDPFIRQALDKDGLIHGDKTRGEDLGAGVQNQYSKLMEFTLFTRPVSSKSGELMSFINDKFTTIAKDLGSLDDAAFEKKYGGNKGAIARSFGEMTGEFFKALESGLKRVSDDAAKAAEIMDPIFKLVDFGVGKALDAAGPIGKVIDFALDQSKASDQVRDAIKEHIRKGEYKEAIEEMKKAGIDVATLAHDLYSIVSDELLPDSTAPNGVYNGISIKDAWQNGYDHVKGAP